ncbi:MAG: VWA domain-containing protein, partial [Acidimicrobiia bacterium]|nr:VWA domain-containing protein [Acidimicrobiia bacterium]
MTRRVGLLVALTLATAFVGVPAAAPQEEGVRPGILLVLDGSGSMNALDESGRSLLDGAKDSLLRLVDVLPEGGVDVGLRVYGHRTSNDDPVRGCADSELVVPVGPLDTGAMRRAIEGVRASGYTPIGLSLTEAAGDLAGRDAATVILVSDGEDTCAPPDPCEVAGQLADAGITVNTVGFYLEDGSPARGQLECIAGASGGTYTDVDEAD